MLHASGIWPASAKADELANEVTSKKGVLVLFVISISILLLGIFFSAEFSIIVLLLSFYYAVTSAYLFLLRFTLNLFYKLRQP